MWGQIFVSYRIALKKLVSAYMSQIFLIFSRKLVELSRFVSNFLALISIGMMEFNMIFFYVDVSVWVDEFQR